MGKDIKIAGERITRSGNIWGWKQATDDPIIEQVSNEQVCVEDANAITSYCPDDSVDGKTGLEAAALASAALLQLAKFGISPYSEETVERQSAHNRNFSWGTSEDGKTALMSYQLKRLYARYIFTIFTLGISNPDSVFRIKD